MRISDWSSDVCSSDLLNPVLMVMVEPTEGLAPVIVNQMMELFGNLAESGLTILLIEQNLSVVLAVADNVAVMENGRLGEAVSARKLREDIGLQRRSDERRLGKG